MNDKESLELTTNELLARGWTRTLIKRFLPHPDGCAPVDHWANFRGTDTYAATKVWNIQQSEDFEAAFLNCWKGRKSGRMAATKSEDVLAEMRKAPHPKIPRRTKEDIKQDTAIAEAAAIMESMRARGFRTPHKC